MQQQIAKRRKRNKKPLTSRRRSSGRVTASRARGVALGPAHQPRVVFLLSCGGVLQSLLLPEREPRVPPGQERSGAHLAQALPPVRVALVARALGEKTPLGTLARFLIGRRRRQRHAGQRRQGRQRRLGRLLFPLPGTRRLLALARFAAARSLPGAGARLGGKSTRRFPQGGVLRDVVVPPELVRVFRRSVSPLQIIVAAERDKR